MAEMSSVIERLESEDDSLSAREGTPTKNLGFQPVGLDRVPSVDALLVKLGLGPFVRDSLSAPVGRNDVWSGFTANGRKVFVKKLLGHDDDVRDRMRRILAFERFSESLLEGGLPSPRILGSDLDEGLVVFGFLETARNGAELMVDETFDNELAATVGRMIGRLHAAKAGSSLEVDQSLPKYPPIHLLQGLPLELFDSSSFGELETWRLMQGDSELVRGLERLRAVEERAPKVPSHCDLRVDQFLIADDKVYLADWEEFRLADPARDVGAFAGEWLYRSVLDIVTNRGDTDTVFLDLEMTHDTVLSRGVEKMERLLPRARHFWLAYREVRPDVDEGLAVRATAFAGWHLLDRLVAGAARASRLSGIARAAAGVGRAALLTPEKFATTLGFGDPE